MDDTEWVITDKFVRYAGDRVIQARILVETFDLADEPQGTAQTGGGSFVEMGPGDGLELLLPAAARRIVIEQREA
jgi:hypothetical protein